MKFPPLGGFLIPGFVLHAFGMESSDTIDWVVDVGTLLLLVGVGLKLQLKTLTRPAVWVATSPFRSGQCPHRA